MIKRQELSRGQQFWLMGRETVWRVEQGRMDIYLVKAGEAKHQQIFLLAANPGDYLFTMPDETGDIRLLAVAAGETELAGRARDAFQDHPAAVRQLASRWFNQAITAPWLAQLAKLQDEVVMAWTKPDVFGLALLTTAAAVWEVVDDYHDILSILAEGQFAAQRRKRKEQLTAKQRAREKLLLASAASLLDRKDLKITAQAEYEGSSPVVTLVRIAADFLQLPAAAVTVAAEVAGRTPELPLLRQLIKKAGMQIRLVKLEQHWFRNDCGVLFGYAGKARDLVVLLPVEPGKYHLYNGLDPAGIPVDQTVAGQLSADAFVCYAGLNSRSAGTEQLFRFMLQRCWTSDLWTILGTSLLAGSIPLLTPLITETIFSDIIPINDRQALGTVTQLMLVAAFTVAVVSYVRSVAVLRLKSHINMAAEAALWSRLLSLPATFFRNYQAGDLVQRMGGITEIMDTITGAAVTAVFNLLFSVTSIGVMAYYSWELTAVAVGFWTIYILTAALIYWQALAWRRKMVTQSGKVAGQVLQIFNGLSKFRMAGGEERAYFLWARLFGEEWQSNIRIRWQNNRLEIVNAIQPLLLSMLMYALAMRWLSGADGGRAIAYPEFLGFLTALTGFNTLLVNFIPQAAELLAIRPQLERLQPVLACEPETSGDKEELAELKGYIEFADVSFRYRPDGPLILNGISFHITAGQTVAVVGTSGCGKSTLVRLLLGFEQAEQGEILIDGHDIAEINMASVRMKMGVVLQNGQLLSGDIFTNIVGTLPLTLDDAWKAAEMVGLASDIRAMPMGMHTVISEGATNISGGQRQRILIARSLVHQPAVVIMDEATSALDNTTQAIITASVNNMQATRLIIAHRLSTIRAADSILVMEKGRIVETGTFDELMTRQGLFARLAERQLA